eukprot:scpid78828/ scgid25665/ 
MVLIGGKIYKDKTRRGPGPYKSRFVDVAKEAIPQHLTFKYFSGLLFFTLVLSTPLYYGKQYLYERKVEIAEELKEVEHRKMLGREALKMQTVPAGSKARTAAGDPKKTTM